MDLTSSRVPMKSLNLDNIDSDSDSGDDDDSPDRHFTGEVAVDNAHLLNNIPTWSIKESTNQFHLQ